MSVVAAAGTRRFALIGTPNSGKTALFNALTGSRQKVANYPGVTVERKSGALLTPSGRSVSLVDLPGTYSLRARSPDEEVTRDVVLGRLASETPPDLLVCVADATNLRLALRLVVELKRVGRPLLLVLALGKAAEVLGGGGQGALVLDGGGFATAYAGLGPWGSPGADLPAIPAQLLEAAMATGVLVLVGVLGWRSSLRRADGRLFGVGLAAWAFGRGFVATTWRDAPVWGPLGAEQLICLAVAALAFSLTAAAWLVRRRARVGALAAT